MLRWEISRLAGAYQVKTGESLTYRDISEATGLAESTLSRLGNGHTTRIDFETVETLLAYFSEKLDRQLNTNDLLSWDGEKVEEKPKKISVASGPGRPRKVKEIDGKEIEQAGAG
jgi:DNA-binding Xre family transcriptional regulator